MAEPNGALPYVNAIVFLGEDISATVLMSWLFLEGTTSAGFEGELILHARILVGVCDDTGSKRRQADQEMVCLR